MVLHLCNCFRLRVGRYHSLPLFLTHTCFKSDSDLIKITFLGLKHVFYFCIWMITCPEVHCTVQLLDADYCHWKMNGASPLPNALANILTILAYFSCQSPFVPDRAPCKSPPNYLLVFSNLSHLFWFSFAMSV